MFIALAREERDLAKRTVLFWHERKWWVHVLSVMPEHVHVMARPLEAVPGEWYSLPEILHSVKRQSSRAVNLRRGREGTLWDSESFDHIVRDEQEFEDTFTYILSNAGRRGLVLDAYEWDGFWCDGLPLPEGLVRAPLPTDPACMSPSRWPRVTADDPVRTRRDLPHLQVAGSVYSIRWSLLGAQPEQEDEHYEWHRIGPR